MSSVTQVPKKSTVAVRITQDAREWLEREAKVACRTMSGQVMFLIERERERQQGVRQ